jgi:uncharacterized surface protein with fasciclin (FAS1) repeats
MSSQTKDLVAVATEAGNLNALVGALQAAGLVDVLKAPGPYTVFAPTDEAFAKLAKGALDSLLADKEKLASLLTYHVVRGQVRSKDLIKTSGAIPATLNGLLLKVQTRDNKLSVNGAKVVKSDVAASNGVIHLIDAVLVPKVAEVPAGG